VTSKEAITDRYPARFIRVGNGYEDNPAWYRAQRLETLEARALEVVEDVRRYLSEGLQPGTEAEAVQALDVIVRAVTNKPVPLKWINQQRAKA